MDTRFAGIAFSEKTGTMLGGWVHAQRHLDRRKSLRSIVTGHSATVTADSGNRSKSVTFDRNDRSRSAETSGHIAPELPVTFSRNTQAG
jgi:hypothetical protein